MGRRSTGEQAGHACGDHKRWRVYTLYTIHIQYTLDRHRSGDCWTAHCAHCSAVHTSHPPHSAPDTLLSYILVPGAGGQHTLQGEEGGGHVRVVEASSVHMKQSLVIGHGHLFPPALSCHLLTFTSVLCLAQLE